MAGDFDDDQPVPDKVFAKLLADNSVVIINSLWYELTPDQQRQWNAAQAKLAAEAYRK